MKTLLIFMIAGLLFVQASFATDPKNILILDEGYESAAEEDSVKVVIQKLPDVTPCPAPLPTVKERDELVWRAKYLFGPDDVYYLDQRILDRYLEMANSGDHEAIRYAHMRLDKEQDQRAVDNLEHF